MLPGLRTAVVASFVVSARTTVSAVSAVAEKVHQRAGEQE
jgi:hypothetical protein